jgi:serine/threonine protein kinase
VPLVPGDALGPYVVLGAVGSGGMGEVYKARDTRLNRIVALKVIAHGLGQHPEARRRFSDEALAVAALNHPHICALYDTGHALDRDYLVLEFLEGENLAHRLRRGPLTVAEALGYSIEIAEALDYAHQQGIAHRDLKPANVLLTRSGGAKLLDFGLATLRATTTDGEGLSGRITQPIDVTKDGPILGTLPYLAPERFDGCTADARSDVFSFGAVLYEMLTSRRAFDEATPPRLMAAILTKDPPPIDPASPVPQEFHWVVQTCLAKNPSARWQSMRDVANILKGIARTSRNRDLTPVPPRRWRLAVIAALAGIATAGVLFAVRTVPLSEAVRHRGTVTMSVLPPPGSLFSLSESSVRSAQFAVSPDGRSIAFVAVTAGLRQLWVRELSRPDARLLPGTNDASYPFWSADSLHVGYFADGHLKKVRVAGGPPLVICKADNGRGAAWGVDDRIVFAADTSTPLSIVSAGGADAQGLTVLAPGHMAHRWPQILADGRLLLFVRSKDADVQGIYLTSIDRPGDMRIVRATPAAGTVASGQLLFVLDGELVAQPLDVAARQLSGEAMPLGLRVSTSSTMSAPISASATGVLATWSTAGGLSELVWFDRRGAHLGKAGLPDRYIDFRLGPDGKRVALARVDAASNTADLAMLDLERNFVTTLTSSAHTDATPIWSADGERLAFRSNRNGPHDLFTKSGRESGGERLLHSAGRGIYPTSWSPDGGSILFHMLDPATKHDIWRFDLPTGTAVPLQRTRHDEMQGQLARSGRLAYTSSESGELQIYVRTVEGTELATNVSSSGGFDPHWRADGRELFFVSPAGMLMAADVSDDGRRVSKPRSLFLTSIQEPPPPYLSDYDVTADGRRFLIKVPSQPQGGDPIAVTLDWLDRLGARVR